jgi:hypothetical protein
MDCVEFERVLSDCLDSGSTPEQLEHLHSCSACANLLADLNLISAQAKTLRGSDEPGPTVWNSIESQLRSEGLIRRPEAAPSAVRWISRWRSAWLVPAFAALAIVAGIKLYHPANAGDNSPIQKQAVVQVPITSPAISREDEQILHTVASRSLAQQARFRAELDDANSFIRDAEESLKNNPNDVYTQQMLINAYEQKQMLYYLAVDRNPQ